jgi:hypothetical protein
MSADSGNSLPVLLQSKIQNARFLPGNPGLLVRTWI